MKLTSINQIRRIAAEAGYYRLIPEDHRVEKVDSVEAWAEGIAQLGEERRHVGEDRIGECRVSTVFIGIVSGLDLLLLLDGHPPRVFETLVWQSSRVAHQAKAVTWDEAVAMHAAGVKLAQRLGRPQVDQVDLNKKTRSRKRFRS